MYSGSLGSSVLSIPAQGSWVPCFQWGLTYYLSHTKAQWFLCLAGTFCFPALSLSQAPSHCVPWGNFKEPELTKFADVISRDSKAFTFRESCTSGSWQIPSSSASHQALREDEAQGSWLPLLPGARAAAGTRLTDTLSQLDEKGRGSGSFRVARAEEDRQACGHCAKEQMLWTVTKLKEHSYGFWNAGSGRRPSGTKLGKA